jgi:hypothetical protein
MLFMHQMSRVVGANLHEALWDFHSGRDTMDAMFGMHQLSNATQQGHPTPLRVH